MLFSLSSFSMNSNVDKWNWVCIKLYYPLPNAIVVNHANGTEAKSIISTSPENVTSYSNTCGTYKYFYKTSIVHFIVTGDPNCNVRVSLTSSVQVTARLNVEINSFFENNG